VNDIDHTYWYMTRAAGFVAYMLLFVAVVFGLTMTSDVVSRWLARFRVYDLHRFLSLLALAASVFHALIVLPDRYIAFTLLELLVPFASPYRPFYMALGTLSLYLTAFIVGTFYLRRLVPYRVWRLIHYATFGAFGLALLHGAGAGSDTAATWPPYLYAATGLIAFNLLVYRALKGSARPGRPQAGVRARHAREA
jgi:predicted ferric reductase